MSQQGLDSAAIPTSGVKCETYVADAEEDSVPVAEKLLLLVIIELIEKFGRGCAGWTRCSARRSGGDVAEWRHWNRGALSDEADVR